jgi:hypothetical protein
MLVQAVGGAIAVVVSVYMTNFIGKLSRGTILHGRISFKNSQIFMIRSTFMNCAAESLADSSFGTSSVFGGAFALLHRPQVYNFRVGLLLPTNTNHLVTGSYATVLISNSNFMQCSASSSAISGRLGKANGGGGAIYASSMSLTNFNVTESTFSSTRLTIASGATGSPSFSSGGALSVEQGVPDVSSVSISFSSFFNCTVQGANISNMVVQGGAVHVFGAAHIAAIETQFTNCSVIDAVSGSVVGGGSSMSAVVTGSLAVRNCVFDASGSQDTSDTSTGLLVLARNASHAHVNVSSCTFIASMVALSVRCVDNVGTRNIGGCVGPNVLIWNSTVAQVLPQTQNDFIATGGSLMSLQNPESLSFTGSRMRCALPQFAAFKDQPAALSGSITEYSCRPCRPFHISLAATKVSLEVLSNSRNVDRCFPLNSTSSCPFAVADCTTFVRVSIGFWANISDQPKSEILSKARRCPRGYCGCINSHQGSCPLPPPISIVRNTHPLCLGNRTGTLCGGCPSNFTQSLDDMTCISNERCLKSLWWVWTLSILGFAAYSLHIVLSCRKLADGAFSCLVFYFQISSFADSSSVSDQLGAATIATILKYSQAGSVTALYEDACYAPSMSAYNATALKLIGPLFVLVFAVAWTWAIQNFQPWLRQRHFDISASYSGSITAAVLFVFSNVSSVVFTLVECSEYSDDGVVFIDGTVSCEGKRWIPVAFVAALLFLFPAAFATALHLKRLPQNARDTVCGKFTEPMFYWGTIALTFRLLISVTQFLRVDFPNLLAFVRSLLSTAVLVLLVNLRPYVHDRTFWVDVTCYVCLIAQFGLQVFDADREFLGVARTSGKQGFFTGVLTSSTVFRRDHVHVACL